MLQWLYATGDAQRGLCLSGYLREFWYMRGHLSEGRAQARLFLDLPAAERPTTCRATALTTAAWLALWQRDDEAIVHAEEALAIWRTAGAATHVPMLLLILGLAANVLHDDLDRATALLEQTLAIARTVGDTKRMAQSLSSLGNQALRQGDLDRATALIEESMAISGAAGDLQSFALAMGNLAGVAWAGDDLDRARDLLQERLQLYWTLDDKWGLLRTLHYLGAITIALKQPALAVRFVVSVTRLHEMTGIVVSPNDRPSLDQMRAELGETLGDDAFQAAWLHAMARPLDEIIQEALDT